MSIKKTNSTDPSQSLPLVIATGKDIESVSLIGEMKKSYLDYS